jgi:hypothetical protein
MSTAVTVVVTVALQAQATEGESAVWRATTATLTLSHRLSCWRPEEARVRPRHDCAISSKRHPRWRWKPSTFLKDGKDGDGNFHLF